MYYMKRRREAPSAVEALCSRAMFLIMFSTELCSWVGVWLGAASVELSHLRLISERCDGAACAALLI